ncbi:MAG: gamma-glutamyltransferase family protein [Caldilineaceae bacterium]
MSNCIVAPQPPAVEAGAAVLQNGGNAIDAAVTAALVQGVIDPQMCGLGGYAILNMHVAGEPGSIGLDAPALAGARVTPDMWVDDVIGPNPDGWGFFLKDHVNEAGYTAICAPGSVKMLSTLLENWGTIDFAAAVAPAIQIAEEGFVVGDKLANGWKRPSPYPEACSLLDYILRNPEARRIYLRADGRPYDLGQTVRNPDYASTLRHLATYGPEDFYTGELAGRMAADLAENGSFVTAEDLADYHLREGASVHGTYHGYSVTSAAPPHGGATLIAILNILEGYDLAALGHNTPEYVYLVSMAMKAAFADRNQSMADMEFVNVPLEWMLSKERAAHWRAHIDAGDEIKAAFSDFETPHTTQVTVVDDRGNCVSLTHSLGASSGVITPGLGFMYNNSMINFHPLPGHANSIHPGKGRTTGMAPTIVYRRDKAGHERPILVLGAPGATRIITSVLQVILNVLVFDMPILDAVHAPRFDCQVGPITCQRRIPSWVLDAVRHKHPIQYIPYSHGGMGLVNAIAIDPVTGALSGAADTGSDGMALVV